MSASGSVIHDLGYRRYQGERAGVGPIAWSMYVTGLRNVFGLGRSGKSKIMPFLLLGLNLAPAAILVAVVVMVHLASLPRSYAEYAGSTQVLSAVFAGAQAPILFSRDIRSGAISLYLARPLGSAAYALCRWASLTTALFGFLLLPILVLYLGAILAEFDVAEESVDAAGSVLLALLLAGMLASVSAVISSVSIRRGSPSWRRSRC